MNNRHFALLAVSLLITSFGHVKPMEDPDLNENITSALLIQDNKLQDTDSNSEKPERTLGNLTILPDPILLEIAYKLVDHDNLTKQDIRNVLAFLKCNKYLYIMFHPIVIMKITKNASLQKKAIVDMDLPVIQSFLI